MYCDSESSGVSDYFQYVSACNLEVGSWYEMIEYSSIVQQAYATDRKEHFQGILKDQG